MSGFFADQDSTVVIEFPADSDGPAVTVTMRKYYDAGITEDVSNNTLHLKMQDGDDPNQREGRVALGNLFTLQRMILKIDVDGDRVYTSPIGLTILRKMKTSARAKLIGVVNENNPLEDDEKTGD